MQKALIFLLFGLSITSVSIAQNGYEKVYGGSLPDWFHYVLPTSDGGSIACGDTKSFGFGDISNTDGYVVKLNEFGDTLWTRNFGTINSEEAYSAIENKSGYLVSGYNISPSNSSFDFYAVQYDVNGNQLWENYYGGTSGELCLNSTALPNNQAVLCGSSSSYTNGSTDMYVVKIDSDGTQLADAHFGGAGFESAYGITRTSDGGYALAGFSNSTDPNYNIYLVKIDSDFNLLWSKDFGGIYEDLGYDIVEDGSGNLWLLGYETVSPDSSYMVVIKTDSNGENAVTYHPGPHAGDLGNSIRKTNDGGFLISGVTSVLGKGSEMLLEKLNSNGDTLWTRHFGGSKNEYGYCGVEDDSGNIYVAGETDGFGVNQFDAYLVKLDSLGNAPCPTQVSFTSNVNEICEDENVFFTNTTISSQAFSWAVDGNEFSNDVDAGYYFSNAGNFSVVLNVCSASSSEEISVNAKPATHFTYSPSGNTINFVLDPGIDVQSISWNFGDGSSLDTTNLNPSHTYPATFQYWVIVTVTNSAGCDSTYTEQIDVVTGTNEVADDGLIIYPNPTRGKINVKGNFGSSIARISILTIDGRQERSWTPAENEREISVADLIQGTYFLKLDYKSGESTLTKFGVY